ncbi:MAG: molybdopterin-dependent oxidoreductase [Bryobacteraceae bacterium]
MNRRLFLASAAAAALRGDTKLLLPSDQADEYNFRLMWYNPVPAIDPAAYRLQVKGLVEKPLSLTVPDLRRLPHDSQNSRLRCVQGWSARTDWGGFRFGHLLEAAKPQKNARVVRVECADKWYEYFSIEDLLRPRVLFAMDMHGQPLADRHGAPLRIVDPARYGYKSAKLITSIEFVESGKGSMACDIASYYSPTGEIQAGYDTPLDLGGKTKRKIYGGEITEY